MSRSFSKTLMMSIFMILFGVGSLFAQVAPTSNSRALAFSGIVPSSGANGEVKIAWSGSKGDGRVLLRGATVAAVKAAMTALGGATIANPLTLTGFSPTAIVHSCDSVLTTASIDDVTVTAFTGNTRTAHVTGLADGDYAFGVLDFARSGNNIAFYNPMAPNWNLGSTNPRAVTIPEAAPAVITAPAITAPVATVGITSATIEFTGLLSGATVQGGSYALNITQEGASITGYPITYVLVGDDFTTNKFSVDVYGLSENTAYVATITTVHNGVIYMSAPVTFTTGAAAAVSHYEVNFTPEGEGGLKNVSGIFYINENTTGFYVTYKFYSDASSTATIMDQTATPTINIAYAGSAESGDIIRAEGYWEDGNTYTEYYTVKNNLEARTYGTYTFTVTSATPEGATEATTPLNKIELNHNILCIDNVKPTATVTMESSATTPAPGDAACGVKLEDATLTFTVTFSNEVVITGITAANLLKFYSGTNELTATSEGADKTAYDVLTALKAGNVSAINWITPNKVATITWTFPTELADAVNYAKTLKTLSAITVKVDHDLITDVAGNKMAEQTAGTGTLTIQRSIPKITSIAWSNGDIVTEGGKKLVTEVAATPTPANLTLTITFDEAITEANPTIDFYLGTGESNAAVGAVLTPVDANGTWSNGGKAWMIHYTVDRTNTFAKADPLNIKISGLGSALGNNLPAYTTATGIAGTTIELPEGETYAPIYFDIIPAPEVTFATTPVTADAVSYDAMQINLAFVEGADEDALNATTPFTLTGFESATGAGQVYSNANNVTTPATFTIVGDAVSIKNTAAWGADPNTTTYNMPLELSNVDFFHMAFGNQDAKGKLYRFLGKYTTINGRDVNFATDGTTATGKGIEFHFVRPVVNRIIALKKDGTDFTEPDEEETIYFNRASNNAYFLVEFSEAVGGVTTACFSTAPLLSPALGASPTSVSAAAKEAGVYTTNDNPSSQYWIVTYAKGGTANSTALTGVNVGITDNTAAQSAVKSTSTGLFLDENSGKITKPYTVDCASPYVVVASSKLYSYNGTTLTELSAAPNNKLYANATEIRLRMEFSEPVDVQGGLVFKLNDANLTATTTTWYSDAYTTEVDEEEYAKYLEVTFAVAGTPSDYKVGGVAVANGTEYTITAATGATNDLLDVAGNALASAANAAAYAANAAVAIGTINFTFKEVPQVSDIAVKDLNNANTTQVSGFLKPTFEISQDPTDPTNGITITAQLNDGTSFGLNVDETTPEHATYAAGTVSFVKTLAEFFGGAWTGIENGDEFTLKITAKDAADNEHSATVTWTKNETKPTFTVFTIPANGSTIAPNGLTTLVFESDRVLKTVAAGTALPAGITLVRTAPTTPTPTPLNINGTYAVTGKQITVTVESGTVLQAGSTYKVLIPAGIFEDHLGNKNVAFDDATTWSFSTNAAPKITGVTLVTDNTGDTPQAANHFYKAGDEIYAKVTFDRNITVDADFVCSLATNIKKANDGSTTATLTRAAAAIGTPQNYLILQYEVQEGDITGTAYAPGAGENLVLNDFAITGGKLICEGLNYKPNPESTDNKLGTPDYGAALTARVDAIAPEVEYTYNHTTHTIDGKTFAHYRTSANGVGLMQASGQTLQVNLTEHNPNQVSNNNVYTAAIVKWTNASTPAEVEPEDLGGPYTAGATFGTIANNSTPPVNLAVLTSQGLYTLFVRHTDAAGNPSEIKQYYFGVDNGAPTTRVTAIGDNTGAYSRLGSATLPISFAVTDSNPSATVKVVFEKQGGGHTVTIDGVKYVAEVTGLDLKAANAYIGGTNTAALAAIATLQEGTYDVHVEHTDLFGQTSTSMMPATLDVVGGLVAIEQNPAPNATGIGRNITSISTKFEYSYATVDPLYEVDLDGITVAYGGNILTTTGPGATLTAGIVDDKELQLTPEGGGSFNFPSFTEVTVTIPQGAVYDLSIPNEATTWKFTTSFVVTLNAGAGATEGELNGWTWAAGNTSYTKTFNGAVAIGDLPTPTRTGYTFNGWFTAATGGSPVISTTTLAPVAGEDITLHAQWTEKQTITINADAQTKTYNAAAQAFEVTPTPTGVTGFTVTYNQGAGNVTPKNVGTYNVVITRAEDATYKAFNQTINNGLVINAKTLTVDGLTATDRPYAAGNTTVALTGGTLVGVEAADASNVTATMPTEGTIADANVGTDKPVTIAPIALAGAAAGNYTLTQPTGITVNITAIALTGITLTGTNTKVGTVITANVTPAGATVTYQWYAGGTVIAGATNKTYTLTTSEIGKKVTVIATGTGNYTGEVTDTTLIVYDEYTVTFDANGGTGTIDPQIFRSGKTKALPAASGFTAPAGKVFVKWNTAANGTGTSYTDGQSITITADMELYAIWEDPSFVVTLEAPDATAGAAEHGWAWDNSTKKYTKTFNGTVAIGNLPTPTRTGYRFDGWFTATTAGTQIDETTTVTGAITYHAQWTAKTAITIAGAAQTKTYNAAAQAFTVTPTPTGVAGFTVTYNQSGSTVTPKNVGTYDVTITRAEDNNYLAFSQTITGGLVITPKTLTVTGLTATNRPYAAGNTTVTLTGGTLSGVEAADASNVTATMPTTGTIATADAGNNKPVSFTPIALSGAAAGNYTLTQPTVTVNITGIALAGVTIAGADTKVGTTLTANVTPAGATVTYQWKANGANIAGATNATYTLTANEIGKTITVTATGTGSYTGEVTSAATDVVYQEYTVTFDANGGTGTMAPQTFRSGVAQALSANTFTYPPTAVKEFRGWATSASGAVAYTDGQSITIAANTTLYAVWGDPVVEYTVTFNANGGTGTMAPQTFTGGVAQALTANAFTYPGYTFAGWNTAANDTGDDYADGEEVTITENITLYAQWAKIQMALSVTVSSLKPTINITGYTGASDFLILIAKDVDYDETATAASLAAEPGAIIKSATNGAATHIGAKLERLSNYTVAVWAKLGGQWVEDSKTTTSISTGMRKEGFIESASGLFAMSEIAPSPVAKGDKPSFEVVTGIDGELEVAIYNLAGEKVADVLSTHLKSGSERTVQLSFDDLANGTYTVAVTINGEKLLRQVVVTK